VSDPPFDRLKDALADRYTVARELGRGSRAIVYLAEDLKHQRTVAIKVLARLGKSLRRGSFFCGSPRARRPAQGPNLIVTASTLRL
jgi:aspartate carbamoyltransferase catalytic subunit